MKLSDNFYLDIEAINLAHEFTLDRSNRCEYPFGRGHYGIVYVQSGDAEYRFFDGERVTFRGGDAFFLTPRAAYTIVTANEFKHYTVNFDVREGNSDTGVLGAVYSVLWRKNTEKIERSIRELVEIRQSKSPGYKMRSLGTLYELIALFYYEYTRSESLPSYRRLDAAKEYLEEHFYEPVSLEELAFISNMSSTNFRREWKKHYSTSPMQYRDGIRLSFAKEYLISGYYTVSEVAARCGFDDASYFSRFFKRRTGLTPIEYKREFFGK